MAGAITVKVLKCCLASLSEIRGKEKMAFFFFFLRGRASLANLQHLIITAHLRSPCYTWEGTSTRQVRQSPHVPYQLTDKEVADLRGYLHG